MTAYQRRKRVSRKSVWETSRVQKPLVRRPLSPCSAAQSGQLETRWYWSMMGVKRADLGCGAVTSSDEADEEGSESERGRMCQAAPGCLPSRKMIFPLGRGWTRHAFGMGL